MRQRERAFADAAMAASDRFLGTAGLVTAAVIYVYYTAWVLLTPFVEVEWFHNLFPPRWWALAVPTALLTVALTFVAIFVGVVSIRR